MNRRADESLEEFRARDRAHARDKYRRDRDGKIARVLARNDEKLVEGITHEGFRDALLLWRALNREVAKARSTGRPRTIIVVELS